MSITPFVAAGQPLGPGKADQIKLNIDGGEALGPLYDTGGGQYLHYTCPKCVFQHAMKWEKKK